jgi:predicted alpha/beta-fold hydrolase
MSATPRSGFERVGVVIAHGVAGTSEVSMLENLKDDAAKRGANAVVLQGDVQTVKDSNGNTKKRLAAWAIRTG